MYVWEAFLSTSLLPKIILFYVKLIFFFGCTDDEGGCVKPMVKKSGKKNSQQDLYTRLGLLLGDGARHPTNRRPLSHDSVSSLASLEAHTLASTNTSPVSTLTGKILSLIALFSISDYISI